MPRANTDFTVPHPNIAFFATENHASADSLVGCYTHNKHYQLALIRTLTEGNSFVYKTRIGSRDRASIPANPIHVYILGSIHDIEHTAVGSEASMINSAIGRITVHKLKDSTAKATDLFYRDFSALEGIILQEEKADTVLSSIWTRRGDDGTEFPDDSIFVDYSCFAEARIRSTEPFQIGSNVLLDVTMHRQDQYVDGILSKTYTLIAHKVRILEGAELVSSCLTDP
ncbi:hypothetical protein C8F04DRAFT_1262927 [Mycena alexandri]|uniref:Uncharacterized protein n=1 Tax=Mycena alexandri TaxID=1745969 RepID=A0AAD6SPI1_9AGAR|nr:hypothetical protein C8F04DRAFT_1262927 [Mycena alexandri]